MTDNKFAFEFGDIGGFEWFADVGDCFDGVAFVADDVEVVVAVVVVVVSKSECLCKSPSFSSTSTLPFFGASS